MDIIMLRLTQPFVYFSVSSSMSECACHCGGGSSVTPEPPIERRDSPPYAKENKSPSPNKQSQGRKASVYDCGLSVESEPEMELAH
jgi:hypothetical protein